LLSDYSNWITGQVIEMDGGEVKYASGEFNNLYSVTGEQWDLMEQLIRKSNKASEKTKVIELLQKMTTNFGVFFISQKIIILKK